MIEKICTFIPCKTSITPSSTKSLLLYTQSEAAELSKELFCSNESVLCFQHCWCHHLLCTKRMSGLMLGEVAFLVCFRGPFCLLFKQCPKSSEFTPFSVQNLGKAPHLTAQRALGTGMGMISFPCRCGLRIKPTKNLETFIRILDLPLNQDLHLFSYQLLK